MSISSGQVRTGGPAEVVKAREYFHTDPTKGLIPYSTALYRHRVREDLSEELIGLRDRLFARASGFLVFYAHSDDLQEYAECVEPLSVQLAWLSRQGRFGFYERTSWFDHAEQVCELALRAHHEKRLKLTPHQVCLLYLARARIYLLGESNESAERAQNCLAHVRELIELVDDPVHRAQVRRRLGVVLRASGNYLEGLWLGIKACFASGVPIEARVRGFALLFE